MSMNEKKSMARSQIYQKKFSLAKPVFINPIINGNAICLKRFNESKKNCGVN